jgi:hypothetical protein
MKTKITKKAIIQTNSEGTYVTFRKDFIIPLISGAQSMTFGIRTDSQKFTDSQNFVLAAGMEAHLSDEDLSNCLRIASPGMILHDGPMEKLIGYKLPRNWQVPVVTIILPVVIRKEWWQFWK